MGTHEERRSWDRWSGRLLPRGGYGTARVPHGGLLGMLLDSCFSVYVYIYIAACIMCIYIYVYIYICKHIHVNEHEHIYVHIYIYREREREIFM